MYDQKEGDNLRFLIDVAGMVPRIHRKEDTFPASKGVGYSGGAGGYQSVQEGEDDRMSDVSTDSFAASFVQGSWK